MNPKSQAIGYYNNGANEPDHDKLERSYEANLRGDTLRDAIFAQYDRYSHDTDQNAYTFTWESNSMSIIFDGYAWILHANGQKKSFVDFGVESMVHWILHTLKL